MSQNQDNILITEIQMLPIRNEEDWKKEDPIIPYMFGAYSRDTHMLRIGTGSLKWSELESKDPASYVGPHAHTHEKDGVDEINLSIKQLPHISNGTTFFGTGVSDDSIPEYGYTLNFGYVCENDEEVEKVKTTNTDQSSIFNTWTRFSHATSTEGNDAIPSELGAWTYDADNDLIKNTTNSGSFIGCISLKKYDTYTFQATITSNNSDDDYVGLVIAYITDSNGVPHTLSVLRSPGGFGYTYCIRYDTNKTTSKEVQNKSDVVKWGDGSYGKTKNESGYVSNSGHGYNKFHPTGTFVKVVRNKNIITVQCSDLGETALLDTSLITIDLASSDYLQLFNQPCSIGYCTMSQANTEWRNVVFVDPSARIYNITNGKVEEQNGNSWVEVQGITVYNTFGVGRFVYNEITQRLFYIQDGYVTSLANASSTKEFFSLDAYEQGNTIANTNTTSVGKYVTTASTSNKYFSYADGIFTYINNSPRKMKVEMKMRYVRTDSSSNALSTAYNIVTELVTSTNNPITHVESYTTMPVGAPWAEVTFSRIIDFSYGQTLKVQFTPAIGTRTFMSGDDGSLSPSACNTLYIYSID